MRARSSSSDRGIWAASRGLTCSRRSFAISWRARPESGGLMPLHDIAGPAGRLEALLEEPAGAPLIGGDGLLATGHGTSVRAAVVFAHPHTEMGGTMHTKVVYQAAKALGRIGCAVLRFNFRGAGASAGSFSNGLGEMDDTRAALDALEARYRGVPLWAGGISFRSWNGMSVGADDARVTTLVGIAPAIC